MRGVPYLATLLGLMFGVFSTEMAAAQQFDANGVVYEAARNRIGLMRHCRGNNALDAATADKAVEVIKEGLRALPPESELISELGDRAEKAGEDGFLDAVRRRDIASFAERFKATPVALCQQWAEETLRVLKPKTPSPPITTAAIESPRVGRAIVPPPVQTARSSVIPQDAALPPLPTKAPVQLTEAKAVPQPQIVNMAAPLGNDRPPSPRIVRTAAALSDTAAEEPSPAPVPGSAACRSSVNRRCSLLYSLGETTRKLFGGR